MQSERIKRKHINQCHATNLWKQNYSRGCGPIIKDNKSIFTASTTKKHKRILSQSNYQRSFKRLRDSSSLWLVVDLFDIIRYPNGTFHTRALPSIWPVSSIRHTQKKKKFNSFISYLLLAPMHRSIPTQYRSQSTAS